MGPGIPVGPHDLRWGTRLVTDDEYGAFITENAGTKFTNHLGPLRAAHAEVLAARTAGDEMRLRIALTRRSGMHTRLIVGLR